MKWAASVQGRLSPDELEAVRATVKRTKLESLGFREIPILDSEDKQIRSNHGYNAAIERRL